MQEEIIKRLEELREIALLGAKNVLTVKDVALLLGKSPKTIYNMLNKIPHYHRGRSVLFRKKDIERWLLHNE